MFSNKLAPIKLSALLRCRLNPGSVCLNKHGNSVTILTNLPPPSWAEVDKLNIVTEFQCLLGLTAVLDRDFDIPEVGLRFGPHSESKPILFISGSVFQRTLESDLTC